MKKIGFIIFVGALVLGVVLANVSSSGRVSSKVFNINFGGISGSGNIVKETRDLTDFRSIEVGGIFKVEVTAQKDYSVEVEVDDNLLEHIKTDVRSGVLHIEADKHIKSRGPILVRVSAPDIESVEASGASSVKLTNVKNERLGVGSSGASKISVQGETAEFTVEVSGASQIDGDALNAVAATVNASGASNVSVSVANKLTADASGASKIIYSGPVKDVSKSSSGAGSVSQK
jgi:hypothetical protein